MRRFVVFLLFTVIGAAEAQARFGMESPLFLPSAFFVGDLVEMRVLVRTMEEIKEPAQALHIGWGIVHELRLARHGDRYEIRVFFTPYMPGTQTFPVIRLGGISLPELKVHVRSLIDEGYSEIAPPRPQVILPGTRFLLGSLAVGALVAPLAVFLTMRFGRGFLRKRLAIWRRRFPRRQLKKTLKRIAANGESLDSRGFYFQLIGAVKQYLTARLELELASATTPELLKSLPDRIGNAELVSELEELFQFGDEVKFGGRQAAHDRRLSDLAFVGRIEGRFSDREPGHADV